MKIKIILALMCIMGTVSYSNLSVGTTNNIVPTENGDIIAPNLPTETTEEDLKAGWRLQKNYTAILESKLNVFVPLEIISDVDINAMVIDDEELNIPFELELNKESDKKDYYKLKFSEIEIDIDNDGKIDTYIFSKIYKSKDCQRKLCAYKRSEYI